MTAFRALIPALALGVASILVTVPAHAGEVPAYAADAIHILPDGTRSVGHVAKSGANMRLEFDNAGRAVVQIIRAAEGVMFVLDPATKSFLTVAGTPDPSAADAGYQPPCTAAPGAICQMTGTEVTSGITAEAWQIGMAGAAPTTILWDGVRRRALRIAAPDGSLTTLDFVAMEELAGRRAEHWALRYEVPGQPVAEGAWFYDPELRVELREVLPSGEERVLENIVVGAVPAEAFAVPAGWTELPPPSATQ